VSEQPRLKGLELTLGDGTVGNHSQ
jgi:hypothetical protein